MDGTGIYSIWCNVPYPHLIQRFSDITMVALLIIYYPHLVLCLLNNVIWERDITKSSCISNSHFSIFFNFRIRWSFLFLLSKLILFGVDRVQQHYHKNDFRRQWVLFTEADIFFHCLKISHCLYKQIFRGVKKTISENKVISRDGLLMGPSLKIQLQRQCVTWITEAISYTEDILDLSRALPVMRSLWHDPR